MNALHRSRLIGGVLLIAIFGVGTLAGMAIERSRAGSTRRIIKLSGDSTSTLSPLPPAYERVDLTPEQRRAADSIFTGIQSRVSAILEETGPKLEALSDSADAHARALLTPEQRRMLDAQKGPRRYVFKKH